MNSVICRAAHLLCLFVLLLAVIPSSAAQTAYAPITPQNVGRIEQIERIGNGVVRALTLSPGGSSLAVATTLGVWIIDASSDKACLAPPNDQCRLLEEQSGASSLTFSPDDSQIASGGDDGSVMIWDAGSDKAVERLENHIYPVSAVAWAGHFIASGDESGVVRLWDTSSWSEYRVFSMSEKIERFSFNSSLTDLTANIGEDSCVTWNIVSGGEDGCDLVGFVRIGTAADNGEWNARYLADSGQIQVGHEKTVVTTLGGFYGELGGVFFTIDGRVGASPLKPPYLWSLSTGQVDTVPPPVTSPDGSRVATFGNDGVIHLIDAATQQQIAALHGHIRAVTGVAFSPDGRLLASSSDDGTIQLWDARVTHDSGSLMVLRGHNGGVTSVAFNADGTLIASAGYDGTIRLWGIRD